MRTQDKFTEKNFEAVYRKSRKNLSPYLVLRDIDLYIEFVTVARKSFDLKEEDDINVWHIKQNELKSYNCHHDKQSIKNLCKKYFYDLQGEIFYLKRSAA